MKLRLPSNEYESDIFMVGIIVGAASGIITFAIIAFWGTI